VVRQQARHPISGTLKQASKPLLPSGNTSMAVGFNTDGSPFRIRGGFFYERQFFHHLPGVGIVASASIFKRSDHVLYSANLVRSSKGLATFTRSRLALVVRCINFAEKGLSPVCASTFRVLCSPARY